MARQQITTAEQLLSLREPSCRHELVRGELRRSPLLPLRESSVAMEVAVHLCRCADDRRVGSTLPRTGFLLAANPDTVRTPELAFVRRERRPRKPATGFFPGAPDLAIEVMSPSDDLTAMYEKALCWLEHGASLVWVVDARTERVTVYRGARDVRVLTGDDTLTADAVLPAFAVRVHHLFANEPATSTAHRRQ